MKKKLFFFFILQLITSKKYIDMNIQEEPNLNIFPTNLKSASDFCPECGNILELPLYDDFIECNSCNYKCHILGFLSSKIPPLKNNIFLCR